MLSLEEIDPNSQQVMKIASPRSLEAVQRQGFELTDLLHMPKAHFRKGGVPKEVADQRFRHYEEERLKRFRIVTEERRKIVAGVIPTTVKSRLDVPKLDAVAAVRRMREREELLLTRLQLKKQKELIQVATAEQRNVEYWQTKSEPPKRRRRSLVRVPTKSTSQATEEVKASSTLLSSSVAETPTPVYSTVPMGLSDSEAAFLAKIKRKIEQKEKKIAEARARESAEPPRETPVPEIVTVSYSPSRTEAVSSSCDLDAKAKRHREALRSLDLTRTKRRMEKQERLRSRIQKVKLKEQSDAQAADDRRRKLEEDQLKAWERFQSAAEEKERQIAHTLEDDYRKQQQSRLRRQQIEDIEAELAAQTYASTQSALRRSEEKRLSRLHALHIHFDIRSEQYESRLQQAERLRRIKEYNRTKTMQTIAEKGEVAESLKTARREEMLLKQRLRKELLVEKQQLAERMEKLISGRGRASGSPSLMLTGHRQDSSLSSSPDPYQSKLYASLERTPNAPRLSLSFSKATSHRLPNES